MLRSDRLLMDRRRFLALSGLTTLGISNAPSLFAAPADDKTRQVFVRTTQPQQIIEHFGASDCWTFDPVGKAWNKENKERLADLLFSRDKGIGLSLWRFNFGAGDTSMQGYSDPWRRPESLQSAPGAPIDGSKQSGQQWFLRAAKQHGVEKTLAFTNSPPVWLTKNGRAFADKSERNTNLKPGNEAAFGKYLVDILHYFEKQGLGFDYISPANEPNWRWTGGQEGCSFHPDELRQMALVVASALARGKVKARLRLGELGDYPSLLDNTDYRAYKNVSKPDVVNGGDREYLKTVLSDAALRPALDECFLAHSYWTDNSPHDLENLRAQVRTNFARYFPNGRFWQSEYCVMEHKRDLGMDMALRVASVIHHDLVFAGATSWSWWTALSQVDYKDGLIYTDYDGRTNTTQNILPSKTLWALGNWSRFVRPGARRVDILTDALPDELMVTAFVSADKKNLIVVAVNPGSEALPVQLGAETQVKEFTPYTTDATRELAAGKPCPASSPIMIPARAVVTLVGRMGAATASAPPALLPLQRERTGGQYLYAVDCGESPTGTINDARRNSRADMAYGRDPGTGFFWGYSSYGPADGHAIEKPPAVPDAPRTVRSEESDTPGEGITYRFAVPPNRPLTIAIDWLDPWNDANRRMDVVVQGEVVEKELLPVLPLLTRQYTATGSPDGMLEIKIVRSSGTLSPGADPLVSRIRVQESRQA